MFIVCSFGLFVCFCACFFVGLSNITLIMTLIFFLFLLHLIYTFISPLNVICLYFCLLSCLYTSSYYATMLDLHNALGSNMYIASYGFRQAEYIVVYLLTLSFSLKRSSLYLYCLIFKSSFKEYG